MVELIDRVDVPMIGHVTSLLNVYLSKYDRALLTLRVIVVNHLGQLEARRCDEQKLLVCLDLFRDGERRSCEVLAFLLRGGDVVET